MVKSGGDTEDGEKLKMPTITLVDRVWMRVKILETLGKIAEAGNVQSKRQRPGRRVERLQGMADRSAGRGFDRLRTGRA